MFLRKFIKFVNPYAKAIQKRASGDILSEEGFRRILELERDRTEHSRHGYCLVTLDTKEINKDNRWISNAVDRITRHMRKIDQIGWCDSEHIGIILPYTPFQGACELIEDICKSLDSPRLELAFAVYIYPTEIVASQNGK